MTAVQARGRIYILTYVVLVALLDIGLKALLLAQGTLRWSQAGGTIVTVVALWFLWRGSRLAFWLLVACMLGAALMVWLMFSGLSQTIMYAGIAFLAALGLALAAPASQSFLSYQRSA